MQSSIQFSYSIQYVEYESTVHVECTVHVNFQKRKPLYSVS